MSLGLCHLCVRGDYLLALHAVRAQWDIKGIFKSVLIQSVE